MKSQGQVKDHNNYTNEYSDCAIALASPHVTRW